MLGWDPRPSIEQVVVWFAYAIPVTAAFFWPARKVRPPTATASSTSTPHPQPRLTPGADHRRARRAPARPRTNVATHMVAPHTSA